MTAEIVGGIWTGSLALIADAAHMGTDAGGLALALFAIYFAQKAATSQKTYGYLRTEILAALTNAVVLLLLTIYILYEAYKRFLSPPEILSGPMLAVAAVGLVVNGFVKDVLQQLPMEFMVEAQKLIAISLEGSVG